MATRWRNFARRSALGLALILIASLAVAAGHRLGSRGIPAVLAAGTVPTVIIPPTTTTTEPPPDRKSVV